MPVVIVRGGYELLRWFIGKESTCQYRRPGLNTCVGKIPLEKEMATHSSILA